MAVAGLAAAAWLISSETLLQLGVSDQFRGRIFGTLGTTSALASLVGMLLAGALADLAWIGADPDAFPVVYIFFPGCWPGSCCPGPGKFNPINPPRREVIFPPGQFL